MSTNSSSSSSSSSGQPGNDALSDIAPMLAQTTRNQADAADPMASVWVSANAGTGKTHVLTMRVMRLLLAGTAPERILCLTYTKAAAAEMSKRVFDKLARWVTARDDELNDLLVQLLERTPLEAEMVRARQLFALAIETPGGLKVQTIHAFCERLLQRFPLEAGVPPHFSILDDDTTRTLQRQAIDDVLSRAIRSQGSALAQALKTAIAFAVDDNFDDLLRDCLRQREWLSFMLRRGAVSDDDNGTGNDDFAQAEADYLRLLGVSPTATTHSLQEDCNSALSNEMCKAAAEVLQTGSKNDVKAAARASDVAAAQTPDTRIEALAALLLTGTGEPRKALMTKGLIKTHPEVEDQLRRAQEIFHQAGEDLKSLKLLAATLALLRLGNAVMQRYSAAKARRAALDFDDLLAAASNLLSATHSAQWVLFKLDGGLDHILVDEAQDTSPVQWSVIRALAAEFFAGSGAREQVRTLFAVGDEKQSIYGFQGAAPKMFAQMGAVFADMASEADQTWRRIPLTMSFRTVTPVLDCVDHVFADKTRVPGLSTSSDAIKHLAFRQGQAGMVEIWPSEAHEDADEAQVWSPLSDDAVSAPVTRLADRIAGTIESWLANGELLASQNRLVTAGDIIILLRKRRPFAEPIVKALKARGIPVAGADRLMLSDQIAVLDLMALGEFLVLPEDDLSLATVLKSPLFGLDDDHLLSLAVRAKGSLLWSALLEQAKQDEVFQEAADTLKRWRSQADFLPPYEFYAAVLDRDGGRKKMLARLGAEASDPLDEFLNLALSYDDGAPPSLQGLLDWLRRSDYEIKRDMEHGRNEVRVMTVHGAKGLEAPIVFLPDTCSARSGARPGGLVDLGEAAKPAGIAAPSPLVWQVKGTAKLDVIKNAKQELNDDEAHERHRLLYVAMTRARDRLYVAGFEGKRGRDKGCWYDLIVEGLDGKLSKVTGAAGQDVLRWEVPQRTECEGGGDEITTPEQAVNLPDWALRRAPSEPALQVPLAPSRLAPLETDDDGELSDGGLQTPSGQAGVLEGADGDAQTIKQTASRQGPLEQNILRPSQLVDGNRFLRGTLSHALLEYLPQLPAKRWDEAAAGFVERRAKGLAKRVRGSIVSEVLAVLRAPEFAPLFGPGSQAEVPIVASIAPPSGKGPHLKITGQIDRMVQLGDDVLIVDFKTNRPPPFEPEKVADAYLLQLAAYRLAIGQAFPQSTIRAAILWTDGVRIMEIPAPTLDIHEKRLWTLDRSALQLP